MFVLLLLLLLKLPKCQCINSKSESSSPCPRPRKMDTSPSLDSSTASVYFLVHAQLFNGSFFLLTCIKIKELFRMAVDNTDLFYLTADFGVSSRGTSSAHKCNSFKGTPYW